MTNPKIKISVDLDGRKAKQGVKEIQGSFSKLRGMINKSQLAILAFFGVITAGSIKAITNFTKMEGKIVDTLNLFGGGKKEFDQAFAGLIRITGEIPVKMEDATQALFEVNSATNDWASSLKILELSAKAGVAGVATVRQAVDGATSIMNAYGEEAGSVEQILEKFFRAQVKGKCFAKGTEILMLDGTAKKVEDIVINDKIMGSDNKERNILALGSGEEMMYRIDLRDGSSYTVNESHILSLVRKKHRKISRYISRITGKLNKKIFNIDEKITNITVKDYLKKPDGWKARNLAYKRGVELSEREVHIDPYLLGVFLGDGTSASPRITTMDQEIVDYLQSMCDKHNWNLKKYEQKDNKSSIYSLTKDRSCQGKGSLTELLHKYNLLNNKHIPKDYIQNSLKIRLELLAGLIDTDGSLVGGVKSGAYEFYNKNEGMIDDVLWIARSCGLFASKRSKLIDGTLYYTIYMSGDISRIPCKIERKIYKYKNCVRRNMLSMGFKVTKLDVGRYYGFEIDGDRLFLLNDFSVTHNTTVGALADQIGKAAPLAKTLGITFDDLLASTTTLTRGGLKTEEAFTAIRGVLNALAGPGSQAREIFKGLQIDISKERFQKTGFLDFFKEVNSTMGDNNAKMKKAFGRVRALTAAVTLQGQQYETLGEVMEFVSDSQNELIPEALAKRTETLAGSITLLGNNFDNWLAIMGKKNKGWIKDEYVDPLMDYLKARNMIAMLPEELGISKELLKASEALGKTTKLIEETEKKIEDIKSEGPIEFIPDPVEQVGSLKTVFSNLENFTKKGISFVTNVRGAANKTLLEDDLRILKERQTAETKVVRDLSQDSIDKKRAELIAKKALEDAANKKKVTAQKNADDIAKEAEKKRLAFSFENLTKYIDDEEEAINTHLDNVSGLMISNIEGTKINLEGILGGFLDSAITGPNGFVSNFNKQLSLNVEAGLTDMFSATLASAGAGMLGGIVVGGITNIITSIFGSKPIKTTAQFAEDAFDKMTKNTAKAIDNIGKKKTAAQREAGFVEDLIGTFGAGATIDDIMADASVPKSIKDIIAGMQTGTPGETLSQLLEKALDNIVTVNKELIDNDKKKLKSDKDLKDNLTAFFGFEKAGGRAVPQGRLSERLERFIDSQGLNADDSNRLVQAFIDAGISDTEGHANIDAFINTAIGGLEKSIPETIVKITDSMLDYADETLDVIDAQKDISQDLLDAQSKVAEEKKTAEEKASDSIIAAEAQRLKNIEKARDLTTQDKIASVESLLANSKVTDEAKEQLFSRLDDLKIQRRKERDAKEKADQDEEDRNNEKRADEFDKHQNEISDAQNKKLEAELDNINDTMDFLEDTDEDLDDIMRERQRRLVDIRAKFDPINDSTGFDTAMAAENLNFKRIMEDFFIEFNRDKVKEPIHININVGAMMGTPADATEFARLIDEELFKLENRGEKVS